MSFQFLAAFRKNENDQDHFSRFLRALRATHCAILIGALWLMYQSVWFGEFRGAALQNPLKGPIIFSIVMLISSGSCKGDREFSMLVYRSFHLSLVMVIALVAAEVTALLGRWNLEEMLGWWRRALIVVAGTWLLLQASEKAVQVWRSKRKAT